MKFNNKLFKHHSFGAAYSYNLKYYVINGVLYNIVQSLSKSYATKFLDRLHGSEFHITLFNALPGFVAIFATIPAMLWMSKTCNKKKTMGKMFLGSRLFILSFALVPFLPPSIQPMTFVVLTALMNFPETTSVTALQSFSGDIFRPQERASAISLKNKFSTLAQMLAMLVLGTILSIKGIAGKNIIILYQVFFALAFIIGLFEIKSFYKLKEVSCNLDPINLNFKEAFKEVWGNKGFRIFMLCSLLFHFGWQMGWPLFTIYQIKYLHADEGWLTIMGITSNIIMFFSFGYWNKLINKKGNPFVMAVTTMGMALTPLMMAASPTLFILTITNTIAGFFTSGTITVILSSLLEVCPERHRMLFVGVHSTLTNITLALSPMLGNYLLSLSNIYIALCITAFFRIVGSIAFFIRSNYMKKSNNKLSIEI